MKFFLFTLPLIALLSCQPKTAADDTGTTTEAIVTTEIETEPADFVWQTEKFADKQIVRYRVPGFGKLSLQQKKLVYYLTQAGMSGRDIMYDQNYRHNLAIRHAIDKIVADYKGERSGDDWDAFMVYAKEIWFANGIHHHYSNDKFMPGFSADYLSELMLAVDAMLTEEQMAAIFDAKMDAKKVYLGDGDQVLQSAINFYAPDVTQAEVEAYYADLKAKNPDSRLSVGLNSRLAHNESGQLYEQTYKIGGLYSNAISEIISWLEKAASVAENQKQGDALRLLIEYYKTGDLQTWDDYNIAWVKATEGDIDYINSFIEVYNDPLGKRGSYETIVEINDFDASARMAVVAENAQWFEDNSPVLPNHKKKSVAGVSYKVVTVAGEAGDSSPSTPIGVNLPNANWIRKEHGSKSVSLGNITHAYAKADGPGLLTEFANDAEEIENSEKYAQLAGKMMTALHEVLGHASGQIEAGIGTPSETLKSYSSALEEGRADLFALYYIPDNKLKELGLIDSDGVAQAAYDSYLRNGLMLQLRRINVGDDIEEAHMRNRQMIAGWVFEKGQKNGAVEKIVRDGKTYINILDYDKMRVLFGELLREVQRIKSQGDYDACKELFENYGVKVDADIHTEVLARSEKLNIPPYGGFINAELVPVMDEAGEISDIKVTYPEDFTQQMLSYAKRYSFLK